MVFYVFRMFNSLLMFLEHVLVCSVSTTNILKNCQN